MPAEAEQRLERSPDHPAKSHPATEKGLTTIWQYNPGTWAAGQTNNINGQHYIKAINVYASGVTTNPGASDTVDFASIVEWEIGNALADVAGYHAASPSQEVGSQSPCSVVK
jgi:hypothetical protein